MTNQQHPITPPPELRRLWAQEAQRINPCDPVEWLQYVSEKAAQWGADKELEACCEWFIRDWTDVETADKLRAARRPKPPSLVEEALKRAAMLEELAISCGHDPDGILRLALERLQELESADA